VKYFIVVFCIAIIISFNVVGYNDVDTGNDQHYKSSMSVIEDNTEREFPFKSSLRESESVTSENNNRRSASQMEFTNTVGDPSRTRNELVDISSEWDKLFVDPNLCPSCPYELIRLLGDNSIQLKKKAEVGIYLISLNNELSIEAAQALLALELDDDQFISVANALAKNGSQAAVTFMLDNIIDARQKKTQFLLQAMEFVNSSDATLPILRFLTEHADNPNVIQGRSNSIQYKIARVIQNIDNRKSVALEVQTAYKNATTENQKTALWYVMQEHGETLALLALDSKLSEDSSNSQKYLNFLVNINNSSAVNGLFEYYMSLEEYSVDEASIHMGILGKNNHDPFSLLVLRSYIENEENSDDMRLLAIQGLLSSPHEQAEEIIRDLINVPNEKLSTIYETLVRLASNKFNLNSSG